MIWMLRLRYLFVVHLLCPIGLHVPWPRHQFHVERCAYCGRNR